MVSVSRAVAEPSGFFAGVTVSGELIPKSSEAAERLPSIPSLTLYTKAGGAETWTKMEVVQSSWIQEVEGREGSARHGLAIRLLTIVVITSIIPHGLKEL